jgi:hypothetical protein
MSIMKREGSNQNTEKKQKRKAREIAEIPRSREQQGITQRHQRSSTAWGGG